MRPERYPEGFPDWAQRERQQDLDWIQANGLVFRALAHAAFAVVGRGAIVADVTVKQAGGGHPFGYCLQELVEAMQDADMTRMVRGYDPAQEFVTILLKSENRTSTYRVKLRSRQT